MQEVFSDCKNDEYQEVVRLVRKGSFKLLCDQLFEEIVPLFPLATRDFEHWMEQTMNVTNYVFNRIVQNK